MSIESEPPEPPPRPRLAQLVLVGPDGVVLGQLPAVRAALPWWPEAASVVAAVRERFGLEVTLLRLLSTEELDRRGGRVTYLAEVADVAAAHVPELEPWHLPLEAQPLRLPYAEPGGPRRDLAWARGVLAQRGHELSSARQVKTWNLSSLWCLTLTDGSQVWLKVVPPFFSHEARVIAAMPPGARVPTLLGHDGAGRALLAEIPGEDLFEASLAERSAMIELLVELQQHWRGRSAELLALGLPDYRSDALQQAVARSIDVERAGLDPEDGRLLDELVQGWHERFERVAEAGVPDTLVHGDFHSGNVRASGNSLTLLDWADSGVGHPLLDCAAFLERAPLEQRAPLLAHWCDTWRRVLPAADPARACELLEPVAAARQAVIYHVFLNNIEPAERVYHCNEPALWLRRTARLLRIS